MRLDRLARRGRPTTVSVEGALPITLSALGGLPLLEGASQDASKEACAYRIFYSYSWGREWIAFQKNPPSVFEDW